ncbi:MAG: hypothetical protein BMS9Abin28_2356 [Anaerolineae bacterium]|nr:MAG: hypothetical protein BMS9Abin28_2356 [Anaerolineae bacterium]
MTAQVETRGWRGWMQSFTAIDLVTIALFAVILRFAALPVYKALYVVFPWNQAVFPLFMAFLMATMLAIVPKPGATLLWTVVWMAINFFLQGEELVYAAGAMLIPIGTEVVFWIMKRWGDDLTSALVGTMVYTAGFKIWDWYALNQIFKIPYELPLFLLVSFVAVFVTNNIGAYIGYKLGLRLKRLIG